MPVGAPGADAAPTMPPEPGQSTDPTGITPTTTQTQAQAAPTDYSSLFQPGYLGTPATINPAQTQGAQYDLGSLLQSWQNPNGPQTAGAIDPSQFSSNNTIQALLQGFAPQAQRSTDNLNQTLADFGVSGGQAIGAQSELQSQLAAALSPSIASAIQNSQGNTLSALGSNQGAQVSQNNLAAQLQGTNYGQQNSALANALGINTANNQAANISNQDATNTASGYNANALNTTNAANVSQQNQSQQQMITNMLNQYYAQMGAFNSINTGGQTGSNNQALQYGGQVTQTPSPLDTIFSGAQAAAPFFAKAAK